MSTLYLYLSTFWSIYVITEFGGNLDFFAKFGSLSSIFTRKSSYCLS